jgi:hypothetical protein
MCEPRPRKSGQILQQEKFKYFHHMTCSKKYLRLTILKSFRCKQFPEGNAIQCQCINLQHIVTKIR